jgi:hypothetical protein
LAAWALIVIATAGRGASAELFGPSCIDAACDNACDSMGHGGRDSLLGYGLIKRSDHCFDDFISPMTNPVFFEDPRTLTEVRGIYLHHSVPEEAFGGDINLWAAQLRGALTDRLSLIATKDGYLTSNNPLIDDGWAAVTLGLKYNLVRNVSAGRLISAGAWYELPVGSSRSLQANGDGDFHLFLTGGQRIGENWHWLSGSGLRLPADDSLGSSMWYWSNHLDVRMTKRTYLLTEVNWYHWFESGENGIPGIEGGDLFNLGSTGVTGNDIVTQAVGVKYKPSGNLELGTAFEFPLTERRDVLENRLTVDLILRF